MSKDRPHGHARHKGNGTKRATSPTPCRNEEKMLTQSTEESKRRHWAPVTGGGGCKGGRQTERSPEARCESTRDDTTADGACGDLSPLLSRWTAVVRAFLVARKALVVMMVGRVLVVGGWTMPILTLGTTAAAGTTCCIHGIWRKSGNYCKQFTEVFATPTVSYAVGTAKHAKTVMVVKNTGFSCTYVRCSCSTKFPQEHTFAECAEITNVRPYMSHHRADYMAGRNNSRSTGR